MDHAESQTKRLHALQKESSKWKTQSQKSQKLIKFLNQNNEQLEEELQEAMNRELELTGQMKRIVLKSVQNKGPVKQLAQFRADIKASDKRISQFKADIQRLKGDLMAANRQASEMRREREHEMGVKAELERDLETLKGEVSGMKQKQGEIQKLRDLVEEVDINGDGDWKEEMGDRERHLECQWQEVAAREKRVRQRKVQVEHVLKNVLEMEVGVSLKREIKEMVQRVHSLKVRLIYLLLTYTHIYTFIIRDSKVLIIRQSTPKMYLFVYWFIYLFQTLFIISKLPKLG